MRSPFASPPPATGLLEELAGSLVVGVGAALFAVLWPSDAPLQRAAVTAVLVFAAALLALWWGARLLFWLWCVLGAVAASYRAFHPKAGAKNGGGE